MDHLTSIQNSVTLTRDTLRTLLHNLTPRTLGKDATQFDIGVEAHKDRVFNIIAKDLGMNTVHPTQELANRLDASVPGARKTMAQR